MMNKRTLEKHHRYILPTIENILSGKETILDVGCGNGAIANYLLDKGYNVYGVDRHPGRIATAGQKHPKRFCVLDMETASSLPEELSDIGFDTIISTEVIEHLYSPRKFLSFCLNTLKGGGKLIISTPYNGYLKYLIISLLGCMDKHLEPWVDGGHIKFYSKRILTELLESQGFRVVRFIGCGRFPYLWKSMVFIAEPK